GSSAHPRQNSTWTKRGGAAERKREKSKGAIPNPRGSPRGSPSTAQQPSSGRMPTKCTHDGCTKQPTYGVAGTKTAELCSGHAKDGMVN
ncbi:unnamed protein product, partial [Pylaiella littoralis]